MGKTSLMARGLQQARKAGARVVLTDFQKLNSAHLQSVDTFSFVSHRPLRNNSIWMWSPRTPGMRAAGRA